MLSLLEIWSAVWIIHLSFINFNKESMDPSYEKLASYRLLIGNHKL